MPLFKNEVRDAEAACALLTPRTRADLETSDGPCAEALPVAEIDLDRDIDPTPVILTPTPFIDPTNTPAP